MGEDLQGRVLVADDDARHRKIVRKLLENDGYAVREAPTGEVVIETVESWHPDLVILDSMLPARCGLECLHYIKHHPSLADTHIVMCSARSDIEYVLKCMEDGAEAFVTKPFDLEKLRNRVRHVMKERSAVN